MTIKLNLKKRILLGYLVPLALMLSVALAVYWSIASLRQISDALDRAHDVAQLVKDVKLDLVQMQRSTRGYILFKNDNSLKNYQAERSQVHEALRTLSEEVKDPAQLDNLRRLSDVGNRLEGLHQNFIDLVDAGKASKAVDIFKTGVANTLVAELEAVIQAMEKREVDLVETRHDAQRAAMAQLMTIAVGATAFAVVLALALGAWIAARIGRSIGEAIAGMSTSSAEIAATVDEHERVVTQQAAAVNETSSTVEELGASSRQSATQAESMAEAAKQSFDVTQEGIRFANQVSESMAGMKQKVGSVAEIQKATNSAVMVTEEGTRTADEVAAIIGKTLEAFGSISTTANGVSVNAQQVLRNSKQQAAGTEQTKKGVQKLNSVALDLKAMA